MAYPAPHTNELTGPKKFTVQNYNLSIFPQGFKESFEAQLPNLLIDGTKPQKLKNLPLGLNPQANYVPIEIIELISIQYTPIILEDGLYTSLLNPALASPNILLFKEFFDLYLTLADNQWVIVTPDVKKFITEHIADAVAGDIKNALEIFPAFIQTELQGNNQPWKSTFIENFKQQSERFIVMSSSMVLRSAQNNFVTTPLNELCESLIFYAEVQQGQLTNIFYVPEASRVLPLGVLLEGQRLRALEHRNPRVENTADTVITIPPKLKNDILIFLERIGQDVTSLQTSNNAKDFLKTMRSMELSIEENFSERYEELLLNLKNEVETFNAQNHLSGQYCHDAPAAPNALYDNLTILFSAIKLLGQNLNNLVDINNKKIKPEMAQIIYLALQEAALRAGIYSSPDLDEIIRPITLDEHPVQAALSNSKNDDKKIQFISIKNYNDFMGLNVKVETKDLVFAQFPLFEKMTLCCTKILKPIVPQFNPETDDQYFDVLKQFYGFILMRRAFPMPALFLSLQNVPYQLNSEFTVTQLVAEADLTPTSFNKFVQSFYMESLSDSMGNSIKDGTTKRLDDLRNNFLGLHMDSTSTPLQMFEPLKYMEYASEAEKKKTPDFDKIHIQSRRVDNLVEIFNTQQKVATALGHIANPVQKQLLYNYFVDTLMYPSILFLREQPQVTAVKASPMSSRPSTPERGRSQSLILIPAEELMGYYEVHSPSPVTPSYVPPVQRTPSPAAPPLPLGGYPQAPFAPIPVLRMSRPLSRENTPNDFRGNPFADAFVPAPLLPTMGYAQKPFAPIPVPRTPESSIAVMVSLRTVSFEEFVKLYDDIMTSKLLYPNSIINFLVIYSGSQIRLISNSPRYQELQGNQNVFYYSTEFPYVGKELMIEEKDFTPEQSLWLNPVKPIFNVLIKEATGFTASMAAVIITPDGNRQGTITSRISSRLTYFTNDVITLSAAL